MGKQRKMERANEEASRAVAESGEALKFDGQQKTFDTGQKSAEEMDKATATAREARVVRPEGDPYEYKQLGDRAWARKPPDGKWVEAKGKALDSIIRVMAGEAPLAQIVTATEPNTGTSELPDTGTSELVDDRTSELVNDRTPELGDAPETGTRLGKNLRLPALAEGSAARRVAGAVPQALDALTAQPSEVEAMVPDRVGRSFRDSKAGKLGKRISEVARSYLPDVGEYY